MDSLSVYNSLSRKKEQFEPINPPFVGMYVCGPTVYGHAHLGHARSAITFDIVYRYLTFLGYKVRYVRNITDVGHLVNDADEGESKVEKQARLQQLEPMEVAQLYFNSYTADMTSMNLLRPSIEPRATGHILEQIEAIQQIIDNGYGYVSEGSVYFDVTKYNEDFGYGKLSGRDLDNMLEESRTNLEGQSEKRSSADFALWKKASPNHIMRWNSPWSEGFPGWHIECTVMSTKYLGAKYDIHGGGMDLLFPHHEAEIAQSNACNCHAPADQQDEAKYWLHNNMITYEGQKMGKSLGNAISLREFFSGDHALLDQAYHPMTIRFFILQAHYRSTLDFSNQALQGSEKALKRIHEAIKRLGGINPDDQAIVVNEEFEQNLASFMKDVQSALNDDFNTARVIARMFDALPVVNQLYKVKGGGFAVNPDTFNQFREDFLKVFTDILGMKSEVEESGNESQEVIDGLMKLVTEIRTTARAEKNWEVSDQIRDSLGSIGIKLEDNKQGTDWYYEK
ncbi:cysteine--tRNA ligase [Pontibacter sp. G13]|uniref:cysteine--tRNA ligase n=1 Tax=Pontibacter sp. G13 TaxID=3074898 RepID=UPI00288C5812|nr:cysteine--tRNA ligase [Pontibacter sp. G13]WNJ19594.1 cysteine--tRNA ligase [Pontibacter sp. G13]